MTFFPYTYFTKLPACSGNDFLPFPSKGISLRGFDQQPFLALLSWFGFVELKRKVLALHVPLVFGDVFICFMHLTNIQEIAVISGCPSVLDPFMGHPPKSGALRPLGSRAHCVQRLWRL